MGFFLLFLNLTFLCIKKEDAVRNTAVPSFPFVLKKMYIHCNSRRKDTQQCNDGFSSSSHSAVLFDLVQDPQDKKICRKTEKAEQLQVHRQARLKRRQEGKQKPDDGQVKQNDQKFHILTPFSASILTQTEKESNRKQPPMAARPQGYPLPFIF